MILLGLSVLSCSKKSNCEIEIVNGLKTYKNSAQPAEPDLKVEFTKLMTIKAQSADNGEPLFTNINGLIMDADKSIYLFDDNKNQVVIIDSTGNLITSFGRLGQGPGEFKFVSDLVIDQDSLIIYDAGHKKFLYFTKQGKFIYAKPNNTFFMFTSKMRKFKENYLAYTFELFKVEDKGHVSITTTVFDSNFKKIQAIDSLGDTYPPKDYNIEVKANVFTSNDSLLVTGKRDKSKYQLKVYDTKLKQLYTITKKHAAIPVSNAERDTLRSKYSEEQKDDLARDLAFSDYKFAFTKIWLDKNNYLWVDKAVSGNVFIEKFRRFDIFKDGVYLCSADLPFGFKAHFELDRNHLINLWNINNRWICYDAEKQTLDIYSYKFTKH